MVTIRIPFLLLALAGFFSSPDQRAQYDADVPKTIVELQQFRQTSSIKTPAGSVTLINLNPAINVWYLLRVFSNGAERSWHLENPRPQEGRVALDAKFPTDVIIVEANNSTPCELSGINPQVAYYPLCGGRLYVRNPAKGHRTALESATEFLRDDVPGGEGVISIFHHLMADRYRETGELQAQGINTRPTALNECPGAAMIDPRFADRRVMAWNLGIALDPDPGKDGMIPGTWYAAEGNAGVCVSVLQPNFIAPVIQQSYRSLVSGLDGVEASALSYAIAFDLDRFDLAWASGTEHPEVNWSDRVTGAMKNARLPGPDGIGSIAPLVSTGLIRPDIRRNTVAAFTGGFKRMHGAFRFGDLALKNHGSHYGFIENGVVFSKLQPGLATIFVLDDGTVDMKTWTESDNKLLPRIKHARQNGVPLVEPDRISGSARPGSLVAQWGPGNWSGSADEKLRTIRAGLALEKTRGKSFLVYVVFSDATPSAMARVFQAYQVNYAMLLDMNALEHTYLAYYRRSGSDLVVDHLLKGMGDLDKSASGESVPRFLGYSDNRDCFYLTHRGAGVKP